MEQGVDPETQTLARRRFRGRVRRRTLALIRWIAVAGQLVTILTVHYGLGFDLPIGFAMAVVAASALFNLWSWPRHPARLSNREAMFSLGFDILQLSLLLFLTGGLHNPFAFLILAPVTIAATILSLSSTMVLGVLSAVCITVMGIWHLPLPWEGAPLVLPLLYLLGLWIAMVLSIGLLAAYNWSVAEETRRMSDALAATQMALAREQRVSALGMLAASTAHQLGSPLGTIAIVAKEIARDLPPGSALADDVALLLSESRRCREILAGLDDHRDETGASPFEHLPVSALIEAAAEPRGRDPIAMHFESGPAVGSRETPEPLVAHSPEIIHGLGSIIENAIQFARSEVIITTSWTPAEIEVTIEDDGPGFSAHILPVIGEPYISSRKGTGEHMGLGLFIAQTLLERTGGVVSFGNGMRGAVVTVRWPRAALERDGEGEEKGAGEDKKVAAVSQS
jgi:two-component system sensor histidine kinase RegB